MADFDEAFDVVCRGSVITSVGMAGEQSTSVSNSLLVMIEAVLRTGEAEKREEHVRRNAHLLIALLADAEIDETHGGVLGLIAKTVRDELGKPPATIPRKAAA